MVRAGQHIYGNVERDVSPSHVGGFQTLYYSTDMITEEESAEIEARLAYHFSETNPVKLLFFEVRNGKAVISRVVPLPDVDKFGRSGIYLGHSFVFFREDLIKLKCNPFVVLELLQERFVGSHAEALRMGETGQVNVEGILLDVTVEITRTLELEMLNATSKWGIEELKKLASGAFNSSILREERKSLAVVGTPEDVESTLMAAFSMLPARLRLNCSFDTYFHGCSPVGNYFWALGYPPSSSVSRGFIFIDATQKTAQMEVPSANSAYERWLFASISGHRLTEIASHKEAALEIQHLLLGEPYDQNLLTGTSIDFLRSYLQLNWSHVAVAIEITLRKALGVNLIARLRSHVLAYCQQLDPSVLVQTLQDGFALESLADQLHSVLRGKKPSQDEIMELREFLKRTRHDLLAVRISAWRRDMNGLRKQLEVLGEEECREAGHILMMEDRVPVADLLAASAAKAIVIAFAELAGSHAELRDQIPHMVRRLISLKQETLLPELMPFLAELKPKQLKEIEAIVREQSKNVPESFIQSLEEALASAGADQKTRVSLLSLLKKGPERRPKGED